MPKQCLRLRREAEAPVAFEQKEWPHAETIAVLADPAVVAAMENLGGAAVPAWTAQQTTDMIANDVRRWADLVPKAGIKGEQ